MRKMRRRKDCITGKGTATNIVTILTTASLGQTFEYACLALCNKTDQWRSRKGGQGACPPLVALLCLNFKQCKTTQVSHLCI